MPFTYDPGTALGTVRLLLGDTDENAVSDLRLEDEDMSALMLLEVGTDTPTAPSSIYACAVACGSALRAKFLRKAEGASGPERIQPTSRAQELANLIATYRTKAKAVPAAPYAGGMSKAENTLLASNPDRVGSFATLGMMDNKA